MYMHFSLINNYTSSTCIQKFPLLNYLLPNLMVLIISGVALESENGISDCCDELASRISHKVFLLKARHYIWTKFDR